MSGEHGIDVASLLRSLGFLLHIPGLAAVASAPVCFLVDEPDAAVVFAGCGLVTVGAGQAMARAYRHAAPPDLKTAMVICALGWLVASALGGIPIYLIALLAAEAGTATKTMMAFQDPLNALFESMSGFTSTGLMMAISPSELSKSLQWWRSLMQWIGGVGIVLMVILIADPSDRNERLFQAESAGKVFNKTTGKTARNIWSVYLIYTLAGVLILYISGVDWWQALNFGLTGISTGGFSITDNSLADFRTNTQWVMILLMIVGAISFSSHVRIFCGAWKSLLRAHQLRALFLMLTLGCLLLAGTLLAYGDRVVFVQVAFQAVSALCSAGFTNARVEEWATGPLVVLVLLMTIGGAAGSTSGGLKLARVLLLARVFGAYLGQVVHRPSLLFDNPEALPCAAGHEDTGRIRAFTLLLFLWLTLVALAVMVLAVVADAEFTAVLFEVTSALGTAGLSSGITGPDLHQLGKITLILLMWMGRLEIMPCLVFLALFLPARPGNG